MLLAAGSVIGATALVWMAAAASTGCAANMGTPFPGADAGNQQLDAALTPDDAGGGTRFVVVNGLVDGGAKALRDVRLCFGDRPNDYPVPDDPSQPMPLANYPGVARGRGVDLGPIATDAATVRVFDAKSIDSNVMGGEPKFRQTCGMLASDPSSYVELTRTSGVGAENLLVLVDDATGTAGLGLREASLTPQALDPATDAGPSASVYGTVSVFADWGTAGTFLVQVVPDAGAPTSVASGMQYGVASPTQAMPVAAPYDQTSLSFQSSEPAVTPRTLEQTFADIEILSDPTVAPSELYGRRANFAFVVVGDPATSAVSGDAGADPSFDGRALHVVAVPFLP